MVSLQSLSQPAKTPRHVPVHSAAPQVPAADAVLQRSGSDLGRLLGVLVLTGRRTGTEEDCDSVREPDVPHAIDLCGQHSAAESCAARGREHRDGRQ